MKNAPAGAWRRTRVARNEECAALIAKIAHACKEKNSRCSLSYHSTTVNVALTSIFGGALARMVWRPGFSTA